MGEKFRWILITLILGLVDEGMSQCGGLTGDVCDMNSDCCSQVCFNDACACLNINDACTEDADCCSGFCMNQICVPCIPINSNCSANGGHCCSKICLQPCNTCACSSLGQVCQQDENCCVTSNEGQGMCNQRNQNNQLVCGCSGPGVPCNNNGVCCSVSCDPNHGCRCSQLSDPCNVDSDCCDNTNLCKDNACYCTPNGSPALNPDWSDCCSSFACPTPPSSGTSGSTSFTCTEEGTLCTSSK